jgi:hypothetical protein
MVMSLEWNVVIQWRHAATLALIHAARLFGRDPRSAAAPQKSNALSDNFGHVSFIAALVIITTSSDTSLDENLPALGKILPARLTLFSPNDDIVPFGSLLPIAVRIRPLFGRGDGEPRQHGLWM